MLLNPDIKTNMFSFTRKIAGKFKEIKTSKRNIKQSKAPRIMYIENYLNYSIRNTQTIERNNHGSNL